MAGRTHIIGMTCLSIDQIRAQLRPASFAGVGFHVDSTSEDFGHRIVVHEFPMSDAHFSESLGKKARKIKIEGYITGSQWLATRDRLIAASESGLTKSLQHPFYQRIILAKCISVSINETRSELGIIKFSMELVEEISISPLLGVDFILAFVQSTLDGLITSAVSAFDGAFATNLFDDSVRINSISQIQDWAQAIDGARLVTTGTNGSILSAAIGDLYNGAENIVRDASIAGFIQPIVSAWRTGVDDYAGSASALENLIWTGIDERPYTAKSALRTRLSQNSISINALFRRSFGGLWAENLVAQNFGSRRNATESRNTLVRWSEAEASRINPRTEPGVLETFDRFRSQVIRDMGAKWTDSAPVVSKIFRRPISALYIANRVYNDPLRAIEVWTRNRASHPSFVGPVVELLSR